MYYLRARYYRPELGRFWTMDSVEGNPNDPLSLHKYLYAHANPVNGVDPSGHGAETGTLPGLTVSGAIYFTLAAITVYTIGNELRKAGPMPTFDWPYPAAEEPTTQPSSEPPPQPKGVPSPQPVPIPQRLDPDEDLEGDLVVHRMGGKANLGLTQAEKGLSPPGFSVLVGGTPQRAAWQMRMAFSPQSRYSQLWELSRTVGTAQISSLRSIGFDVIPDPSRRLPNHGRLIHQTRTAAPFEDRIWLRVLAGIFTDTSVPIP
jgi:hypothetical protein